MKNRSEHKFDNTVIFSHEGWNRFDQYDLCFTNVIPDAAIFPEIRNEKDELTVEISFWNDGEQPQNIIFRTWNESDTNGHSTCKNEYEYSIKEVYKRIMILNGEIADIESTEDDHITRCGEVYISYDEAFMLLGVDYSFEAAQVRVQKHLKSLNTGETT